MTNHPLTMGVIGTSHKENEHRAPIHPAHIALIAADLRARMYFETGYGTRFGVGDDVIAGQTAGVRTREALFETCDIILLPKPTDEDFPFFREGQIHWGWPHCVQGEGITQLGIDNKMTQIAWEAMHVWKNDHPTMHIFYKNNELAGYCSVLHALQLMGVTGAYGPQKRAAVIGFGATGRGSIHALQGMEYRDITVFTRRLYPQVNVQIPGLKYAQIRRTTPEVEDMLVVSPDGDRPLGEALAGYDIIVNCTLQDTDRPLMFMTGAEAEHCKPGTLIVDVSCDDAMGFDFARPTSFEKPAFRVANGVVYYAVDHTPTYLWDAATYEISQALLPFVATVMDGPESWEADTIIRKAIEIKDGVIQNAAILRFQNREETYPHKKK